MFMIINVIRGRVIMSDYRINFGSLIGASDTERLSYMLGVVDNDDELIITMEAADVDQAGNIFTVLDTNGFDIVTKGSNDGEKYNIVARRKNG
jgi:hypothetical protein